MTLIEYIQNVEKSRARVVIFRIFAVLCVCTLFDALVYDALTGRPSTNGALTMLTGYLAWMVHKDNFRQVYMFAVICFLFNAVCLLLLFLFANEHGTNWLRFKDEALFLYSVSHLTIFRAATFSFYTTLSAVFVATAGFGILTIMAKRFRDEAENTVLSDSYAPSTQSNVDYTSLQAKKDTAKTSSRIESAQKAANTHKQEELTSKNKEYPIQQNKKENRSEVMDDLEKRYRKGRIAIQYRDEAKQGWQKIKKMPVNLQLQYLAWLSDDPKREVAELVKKLELEHRQLNAPFEDPIMNECYAELKLVSKQAADEFREIAETLGEMFDPIKTKDIITNRYGKIGKMLVENKSSIQTSLQNRWLPNRAFQLWFADEFVEFRESENLGDMADAEAWCVFIEELYARCGWEPVRD